MNDDDDDDDGSPRWRRVISLVSGMLQHVAQTGPVVQLQHVAATLRPVKRVILPCQNGYYDSNIKVLLIVVKEIKRLRYH